MEIFLSLFAQYGLLAVFLGVVIEQLGAPLPAFPFLLLAGMEGANDAVFAITALSVAALGSMLADSVWFWADQCPDRRLLRLPQRCIGGTSGAPVAQAWPQGACTARWH